MLWDALTVTYSSGKDKLQTFDLHEILRWDPLPTAEAAYAAVRKETAHQNILGKSRIHTINGETLQVEGGGTIQVSQDMKSSNCLYDIRTEKIIRHGTERQSHTSLPQSTDLGNSTTNDDLSILMSKVRNPQTQTQECVNFLTDSLTVYPTVSPTLSDANIDCETYENNESPESSNNETEQHPSNNETEQHSSQVDQIEEKPNLRRKSIWTPSGIYGKFQSKRSVSFKEIRIWTEAVSSSLVWQGKLVTCLIIYVDDMIITGNDKEEMTRLRTNLFKEFKMKDLGRLKYFFGIEILRSKQGIFICQKKYVLDLLAETGMIDWKLIYLSHTRPDIAYAVGVVRQFMHQHQISYMKAVLRIIRYLKGTLGHGVLFKANGHLETQVYTNADWTGDKGNRRSTFGYLPSLVETLLPGEARNRKW
nr:putative reverse transcriptase, RNA-dependent DNA polymerase [Tanacetum cinerariifolium]